MKCNQRSFQIFNLKSPQGLFNKCAPHFLCNQLSVSSPTKKLIIYNSICRVVALRVAFMALMCYIKYYTENFRKRILGFYSFGCFPSFFCCYNLCHSVFFSPSLHHPHNGLGSPLFRPPIKLQSIILFIHHSGFVSSSYVVNFKRFSITYHSISWGFYQLVILQHVLNPSISTALTSLLMIVGQHLRLRHVLVICT